MATGSGLDSYLGTKTEAAVGTLLAPTQFFAFNSAELTSDPTYIENSGIMNGARFKDINQTGIARRSASGKMEIPVMMNGFGWWMKHILGSTANPVIDVTTAFKQIHTPGGLKGLSFTAQVGKPQPSDGTVKIRTYMGCKISDWDLAFADNAITTLGMTVDAWNEDQAQTLPTITYPVQPAGAAGVAGGAFNFSHVNAFTTVNNDAGTAVTSAGGLMSVTGGVAVPSVVTKLTLSGKASLATDRYGLGNAGVKKEQLENDFFTITGAFEGEYDAATWETPFAAGSTIALQVTSTGPQIAATGKNYKLDIVIPAAKITKAPAPVSGPDIVKVSGEFTVYDPKQTNLFPIQVYIESTDSVAW
jgi:hypothetical protein